MGGDISTRLGDGLFHYTKDVQTSLPCLFQRFGKIRTLQGALALQAVFQVSLLFNPGNGPLLVLQGGLIGAGIGGIFMLSQSLLPDVIAYDYQRTGLRPPPLDQIVRPFGKLEERREEKPRRMQERNSCARPV